MSVLEQTERRFSRSGSAQAWNDMYSVATKSLADENFRCRRDYSVAVLLKALGSGARVLDLGCGTGPVVSELRKWNIECVGIDYAPDMLRFAGERLRRLGIDDCGLLRGDCRRIPFADGSFDAVVCLGVISYVERYEEVLREIRRVLRPGGLMIVSFRNRFNPLLLDPVRGLKAALRALLGRARPEPFRIGHFMDHREVTRNIGASGFALRDFHGIGIGPLRINGRALFSEELSIALSSFLSRMLAACGAKGALKWLADVSVWTYASAGPSGAPAGRLAARLDPAGSLR